MTDSLENKRKILIIVIGIVAIIVVAASLFLFLTPSINSSMEGSQNTSCRTDWTGNLVDPCVPLFYIINGSNDTISYENFSVMSQFEAAPSPDECKVFAVKALEQYGGMPPEAVITSMIEGSRWGIGSQDGTVKSEVGTRRIYYRESPYGMTIYGTGGQMFVEIGFGGNVGLLEKDWLSLREVGLVRVIPASKAIEKLRQGEAINAPLEAVNLTVSDISMGYYSPVNTTEPRRLEPVWVISATDEIQQRSLRLFVLAASDTIPPELNDKKDPGVVRTFSQRGEKIPAPDITGASNLLIGTSGPVGEARALDSIRNFTGNPDLALTYNGRFVEHEECGQVYYWVYYDFTSPGSHFKVNTYTGAVLSAEMNRSATAIGIKNLAELMNNSMEGADPLIMNFTRSRDPLFDKRNMKIAYRQMPDNSYSDISFSLKGDSSKIYLSFYPDTGLLERYAVFNSDSMTMCGEGPVRIGD